jgi:hypothetical protein
MTRKRFIKLAMSKGWNKIYAKLLAEMVLDSGKSYYVGYLITLKCFETMELKDDFVKDWKTVRASFRLRGIKCE